MSWPAAQNKSISHRYSSLGSQMFISDKDHARHGENTRGIQMAAYREIDRQAARWTTPPAVYLEGRPRGRVR